MQGNHACMDVYIFWEMTGLQDYMYNPEFNWCLPFPLIVAIYVVSMYVVKPHTINNQL